MTVPVRFPAAPYVELTGVITEVGTRAEAANAFPITLVLNGSSPLLRAGMTAEVDITYTSRADAQANETNLVSTEMMIIPVSALAAGQDQTKYVFVYDPDSQTVSKRDVLANNILGNEVYIAKGLQAGEIIAIAGVSFLRNGQHVTLLDANVKRFN